MTSFNEQFLRGWGHKPLSFIFVGRFFVIPSVLFLLSWRNFCGQNKALNSVSCFVIEDFLGFWWHRANWHSWPYLLFITLLQGVFPDEPASRKLSTKGGSSKTGVLNFEQPDYLKIIKGSIEWYKCHTSYTSRQFISLSKSEGNQWFSLGFLNL